MSIQEHAALSSFCITYMQKKRNVIGSLFCWLLNRRRTN